MFKIATIICATGFTCMIQFYHPITNSTEIAILNHNLQKKNLRLGDIKIMGLGGTELECRSSRLQRQNSCYITWLYSFLETINIIKKGKGRLHLYTPYYPVECWIRVCVNKRLWYD